MRSRRRAEAARRGRREPDAARTAGLPSPEAVLEFLRDNPEAIGAREIARAFGLGAADQPALRAMLRTISRSGELVRGGDRRFAAGDRLPEMMPVGTPTVVVASIQAFRLFKVVAPSLEKTSTPVPPGSG